MSVEAAHFALVLAFVLALAQAGLPLVGARMDDARLMLSSVPIAIGQFAFVLFAFCGLVAAYVVSDFSVLNVWANSHTEQPLLYRVTSVWGNHEGSMLLWVLILAAFGASVGVWGGHLPLRLKALTLAVQGWIAAAFLAFSLFTSNPFERVFPVPGEGQDLNPILQDLGLAIHPPLLYVGYVGFSITFAFAVAALMEGRVDAAWARWVRPWALGAWAFLTLGIAMGSYWAYYELGWGGWWFWDPVENASLMPWLAGTALLHSAIVVEKRDALRVWTILLALLTFALSLLGTFLVRSGVLTSVHSFASDPTRGVVILAMVTFFTGGSLALFAWRAPMLRQGGLFAPVSREAALVLNNLFLSVAAATVLIGTLYPLAYEALTGSKISVGPPFYNLAVTPLFAFLALAIPFGPFLPWKRGDLRGIVQRLAAALALALAAAFAIHLTTNPAATLAPLGIGLGAFCVFGTAAELLWRCRIGRAPLREVGRRLRNTSRAAWGGALAHAGVGVLVVGVTASSAWSTETVARLTPGQFVSAGGERLVLKRILPVRGPNWVERRAEFEFASDGSLLAPSKRVYTARQAPTTEAAIRTIGASQIYLSPSEIDPGAVVVRAHWKPWILLIWWGAILMGAGGFLSLADRRLRIGVPRRAPAAQT